MSKNRRGSGDFLGVGTIDRSHTSQVVGNLPNNSNIGSFAADKARNVDKTNNSQNPMMNWLDAGKVGGKRRGTTKKVKGKGGDELEFNKDILR